MAFPLNRPRRLRRTETIRRMVRETRLSPDDLILPMFVCPGRDVKQPVEAMPGVARMSVDNIVIEAREAYSAGVPAVILFGIPERKDALGSEAWKDDGAVQRAIREIKERIPGMAVITDVCMCEYTDHGHCGAIATATGPQERRKPTDVQGEGFQQLKAKVCNHLFDSLDVSRLESLEPPLASQKITEAISNILDVEGRLLTEAGKVRLIEEIKNEMLGLVPLEPLVWGGEVDNDATLELLTKTALSHARAGADIVAPSDMMDGRVGAIRRALDEDKFSHVSIMAYSAKFASAFYGPFREAASSAPQFGDRRSYQMDPPNGREALREVALDIDEGADIVMVKPALAYLDLIWRVKEKFNVPVAAYNVSGEYSMIRAAGQNGWIDEDRAVLEVLTSIKRAGADLILTYFAKDVARRLRA